MFKHLVNEMFCASLPIFITIKWEGVLCGIFVRCISRNENLRKMMLLLLLSFLIVFVRRLNIVS